MPRPDESFGLDIERNPHSLTTFSQITEGEIIVTLNEVKNNSAMSEIPTKFLKFFPNLLAKLLAPLFNECIKSSYYPEILKRANIKPIFKGGDKRQVGNYRPISLLPLLNKIFESLIYSRLYDFFQDHNLISDNQFGYLRNRSTSQAIIKLIDHTLPAINNKNYSLLTLVDLSKAFDCVSHKMLIAKLERYGVRGEALSLINSYLHFRRHRIKTSNKLFTEYRDVYGGVPQGSVLGPFFYIVYANDLNNILDGIDIVNFADDIALCVNGDHLPDLVRVMNGGLSILSNWSRFNLLPINYEKTHAMVITNRKYEISSPLMIDGRNIPIVRNTVYLGVHIDDRLTFSPHIKYVTDRLSHFSGISWKITYKLNVSAAKNFFYSFVFSLVNYGISAWGGALLNFQCTRTHNLFRRIILNLFGWHFPGVSYEQLCFNFGILTLVDLYKFNILLQYFKISRMRYLPRLKFESHSSAYALRRVNELKVPVPRTNVSKMHFPYTIPLLWNDLPSSVRNQPTYFKFKSSCRKHMLENFQSTAKHI